jgi:hypothetical protein
MNLLYAVSFLRPPPPEDLTAGYLRQERAFMSGTTTHLSSPAFRLLPSFLWASRAVDRLGMDNEMSGPERHG